MSRNFRYSDDSKDSITESLFCNRTATEQRMLAPEHLLSEWINAEELLGEMEP